MNWTPHPLCPIPQPVRRAEDGRGVFRLGEKEVILDAQGLREYWVKREERILRAEKDPLWHGFELDHWKDADELLEKRNVVCIFGGNRAGKSEFCLKRAMRIMAQCDNVNVLLLHNNELASKQHHQKVAWKYMPNEWRVVTRKQGGNINYDPKNGFSDNIFVTPIGGTCIFGNYGQALEKYEGLEFDLIVADENLPLKWYMGLLRGLATRGGKMMWPFTPIYGMTPAIQEVAGGAKTLRSLPVDPDILSPDERHVTDCPVGHMPYVAENGSVLIMYFHSSMNPFGGYVNLKALYGSKDKTEKERRFYGFARKLTRVAFPKFSSHHIVDAYKLMWLTRGVSLGGWTPEALAIIEKEGENAGKMVDDGVDRVRRPSVTRYHIADPAGARNMFQIWVAVDEYGRHFVYREWPDMARYGAWAVPSEDSKRWDGDPGPAQPTLGFGVEAYRDLIWELERKGTDNEEEIFERFMDPRSGAAQSIAEKDGGMSLMDRFADMGMFFEPAPGLPENDGIYGNQEGVQGINDLLFYEETKPVVALFNEAKLFISSDCGNVIWALKNYTGNDGAKAACKDPIDCLRYMATSKLEYVDPKALLGMGGGHY